MSGVWSLDEKGRVVPPTEQQWQQRLQSFRKRQRSWFRELGGAEANNESALLNYLIELL